MTSLTLTSLGSAARHACKVHCTSVPAGPIGPHGSGTRRRGTGFNRENNVWSVWPQPQGHLGWVAGGRHDTTFASETGQPNAIGRYVRSPRRHRIDYYHHKPPPHTYERYV